MFNRSSQCVNLEFHTLYFIVSQGLEEGVKVQSKDDTKEVKVHSPVDTEGGGVKVQPLEDIEEGEVTSDEEGEIKGGRGTLSCDHVYNYNYYIYTESDDGDEAPPTTKPTTSKAHSDQVATDTTGGTATFLQ